MKDTWQDHGKTVAFAIVYPFLVILDYVLYQLACWDARKHRRRKPPRHISDYLPVNDQEWYERMIE